MSARPDALPLGSFPWLRPWCARHPDLFPHLHLQPFPPDLDSRSRRQFARERADVHLKIQTITELSLQEGELNITQVKVRLSELIAVPLAHVSPWYFDETSTVMFVRQYAWVMRETRQALLLLWTMRHSSYDGQMSALRAFQELFSGDLIPGDVICRIDRGALNWRIPDIVTPDERRTKYLQALGRRMEKGIRHFPLAVWGYSVDEFLWILTQTVRPAPDTAYFPPGRLEFSFSRCLFNPDSKFRPQLDLVLENIKALKAPKFGEVLLNFPQILPVSSEKEVRGDSVRLII
jgi:hypothetical protein